MKKIYWLFAANIAAYLLLISCDYFQKETPPEISKSTTPKEEVSTSETVEIQPPPSPVAASPTPTPSPTPPPIPEPTEPVLAVSLSREPNQSNSADSLKPIPLAGEETEAYLDIRGVGDSGMGYTHTQPYKLTDKFRGIRTNFAERLDNFDPDGKAYRGDLSFINWESTIGTVCNRFWAPRKRRAFAFMSHPDNVAKVYEKGFNIIGLANNHTRDCPRSENGENGALVSANYMEKLTEELQANWLWHGVGTQKTARVRTFEIKGRKIKVAFANIYLAGGDCTYVTCRSDKLTVLRSLRDADADLRILSMHSWTKQTQRELINTGVEFIKYYNGDIVFGHGPHHLKPVRVVESLNGKKGVMFESLGNFIHPSLAASSDHIIGRVLFDLETMKLQQIQIIPIAVSRITVSFNSINPLKVPANLSWQYLDGPTWESGVNSRVRGAYSNIK